MSELSWLCVFLLLFSVCSARPSSSSAEDGLRHHEGETQSFRNTDGQCRRGRSDEYLSVMWKLAIGSAFFISFAPFVILFLLPLAKKPGSENLLRIFLALAFGKRFADVVLCILPYAFMTCEEKWLGLDYGRNAFYGFFTFFVLEKLILAGRGGRSDDLPHSSRQSEVLPDEDKSSKQGVQGDLIQDDTGMQDAPVSIQAGAQLNLAACFAQNYIIGLVIGANYSGSFTAGIMTSVDLAFHKLVHDIGDFAVLIQNGMTKRMAIISLLLTNVSCLAATMLAFTKQSVPVGPSVSSFIFGGFLYLATHSVIPELVKTWRFWPKLFEAAALISGFILIPPF